MFAYPFTRRSHTDNVTCNEPRYQGTHPANGSAIGGDSSGTADAETRLSGTASGDLSHEDAEGVPGGVGEDIQRLVTVVAAVEQFQSPEVDHAGMFSMQLGD